MIFVVFVEVEGGKYMCMYYNMYLYVIMLYTYYPTSPRNFVGITRSSGGSRGTPGPCTAAAQRAPWTTLRMLREVLLGKWSENCGEMTHYDTSYHRFLAILLSGNGYVPVI